MKVLIFNTLYYPHKVGGAEVSVQLLAEGLVKKGHEVRVVCLHPGKMRKQDRINNVDVVYLPLKNIYWPFDKTRKSKLKKLLWHVIDTANIFMVKSVDSELADFNPDLVHTNNISGFSVLLWRVVKNRNVKLIHTARDYYLFHPNSTLFKKGKNMCVKNYSVRLWSLYKKRYTRYVDGFIGISNYILDLHRKNGFFKKSESTSIYNPVPVPAFKQKEIDSNSISVGFIGRLSEEKGFYEFCDISKKYASTKFNFIAAGSPNSGSDFSSIQEKAKLCNVSLLGFTRLEDFLSKVDVVIFPIKWQEPFGRSVVECVLANKIVFSSSVGGLIELKEKLPIFDLNQLNAFFSNENKLLGSADFLSDFYSDDDSVSDVSFFYLNFLRR
jgi:glycosyltransferase involved in cell wall biosynthesis